MPQQGRDDERVRRERGAASRSSETHQKETEKNKKEEAELNRKKPKK